MSEISCVSAHEGCGTRMSEPKVLPSEAVYMFVAWITTRKEEVAAGGNTDCAVWPELIGRFCDHNSLVPPRDKVYPDNLEHPNE